MPDLNDEIIRLTPKLVESLGTTASEILNALLNVIEQGHQSALSIALVNAARNGAPVDHMICKNFTQEELEKRLKSQVPAIKYSFLLNKNTGNVVLTTLESDRERVTSVIEQMLTEKRAIARIGYKEFVGINAGLGVVKLPSMTDEEVKLFQEMAKKEGFVFAVDRNSKDGKLDVFVSEKEAKQAKLTYKDMLMRESGKIGSIEMEGIKHTVGELTTKIAQGDYGKKPFYVICSNSLDENGKAYEYIRVDKDGFHHIKNGKLLRDEPIAEDDFRKKLFAQACDIAKPTILSENEFNDGYCKEAVDNKRYRPAISEADRHEIQIERITKPLVKEKMLQDNHKTADYTALKDGSVSYEAFFKSTIENIENDDERQEALNMAQTIDGLSDHGKRVAYDKLSEMYGIQDENIDDRCENIDIDKSYVASVMNIDDIIKSAKDDFYSKINGMDEQEKNQEEEVNI